MKDRNQTFPKRFYSLDLLRAAAALGIVLRHWQHFSFSGTTPEPVDVKNFSLFDWGVLFYSQMGFVYLFFTLSGFVFYWHYSRRIAEGAVPLGHFLSLRFSRLYPLHFVTLLIVAAGQLWLMRSEGSYFVYPYNDGKHFLLNLFFASSWGAESGHSFNAPIWSVSVEVLLYAIFFGCCRWFPVRASVLGSLSLIGFVLIRKVHPPVGLGIGSFFLGGCLFLAYDRMVAAGHARRAGRWATCLAVVGLMAYVTAAAGLVMLSAADPGAEAASLSFRSVPILWRFDSFLQWAIPKLFRYWPILIIFPSAVLSLALIETHRGSLGKRISFLGDISYSVFLLHFPLQLLVVSLAARFSIDRAIYGAPWFILFFFTILILLSFGSYHYFEVPARRFLRRILIRAVPPDAVAHAVEAQVLGTNREVYRENPTAASGSSKDRMGK